jgi:hypothetical protein
MFQAFLLDILSSFTTTIILSDNYFSTSSLHFLLLNFVLCFTRRSLTSLSHLKKLFRRLLLIYYGLNCVLKIQNNMIHQIIHDSTWVNELKLKQISGSEGSFC